MVHFERLPTQGVYSIERVFRELRLALPGGFSVDIARCPSAGRSRWWLPAGVMHAHASRGEVNHITGDVHYVALALPGRRTILTVHDVNHLDDLRGPRRQIFRWLYFTLPLRKCQIVTCVSEHTRQRLVEGFPWVASKVRVIPDCVPDGFGAVPKAFNKSCPRILQLGTRPNKNLERLAEALAGERCFFHIVGRLTERQRRVLAASRIAYQNDVDLSDEALRRVYEEADLVAFVSLAEGFGLPIIEANAIGRAVVTSDASPMKEVAGGAACLVNAYDVDEIRAGIRRVITDDTYRDHLIEKGYKNAARFSAELVAEQYAQLYQEVLASCRA